MKVHVNMGAKGNAVKGKERRFTTNRLPRENHKYKKKTAKTNGRVRVRSNFRTSPKTGISRTVVFRDRNHRIKYCQYSLSRDIETNPGPSVVDPSKTIVAPYSQGNVAVFGHNAGRQCVAMSLSALVFNHTNFICLSEDLFEIMNAGNNLYSTLYSDPAQRAWPSQ